MAQYVDGFVVPVPKKNLAAYKKMATQGGQDLDASTARSTTSSASPTTSSPASSRRFRRA